MMNDIPVKRCRPINKYQKLQAAGFRIFKLDGNSILEKTSKHWMVYNRYSSVDEAKKNFNELLKGLKNIED